MTPQAKRKRREQEQEQEWEKWESFHHFMYELAKAMEDQGVTYNELARRMGTSKGNIYRDMHYRGMGSWSVQKVLRMAYCLGVVVQFKVVGLAKRRKMR